MNANIDRLKNMTPEQRAEMKEKARIAGEERKAYAIANLRIDTLDHKGWRELAKKFKVRLPIIYHPADAKQVRKALKKVSRDIPWARINFGFKRVEDVLEMNPSMTGLEFMGMCLELVEFEQNNPNLVYTD